MAFKEGFDRQFWDHKSTSLEADRLRLISDTSGIDFDLQPAGSSSGSISGTITAAGTTQPVSSHVVGFHRSTPTGRFSGFVRHALTDSAGRYMLASLRSGYYIVLALPQGDFLPTFYDTAGGTLQLANAFPVPVSQAPVSGINIGVFPDTVSGINRVRGTVMQESRPLQGSIVYAVSQQNGNILGAAVSESDGRFAIVGLAPGTYRLRAMKPGFTQTTTAPLTLMQQSGLPATATSNITLIESPTDAQPGQQPFAFRLMQNYPNPFNPSTRITFSLQVVGPASLRVFDVLGREVATLVDETLQPGTYTVEFSGSNLASGVYYYRLKAAGLVETRKMLLIR
jgi:hypothetical protein